MASKALNIEDPPQLGVPRMNRPFKFDASACTVERTDDRHYRIRWQGSLPDQNITIYMFDDPTHLYDGSIDGLRHLSAAVTRTQQREVVITNPDADVRHYFCLQAESGDTITLAERRLIMQGTPNFRDLGGYPTLDGRRIKWGKLYRSGRLSTLTEEDIRYFNGLGVSLVCDFRQDLERDLEPTQLGNASTPVLNGLPVMLGGCERFMNNLYHGVIEIYDSAAFMEDLNRDFVINQLAQYTQMFRLLLAGDHPVLIHCASGKDRTGFGAALILDVLGVDEGTIIKDYLLTNDCLSVENEVERLSGTFKDPKGTEVPESVLRPLIEVRPEYLHACFEEIDKRYGTRARFHEEALGLGPTRLNELKNHYLE